MSVDKSAKLTKTQIEKGLRNKTLCRIDTKPKKSKSKIWNHFKQIGYADNKCKINSDKEYMVCNKCVKVYVNSANGGYGSQQKHVKEHNNKKPNNQPSVKSHFNAKAGNDEKELIANACQQFVMQDLRPFNSVEGKGFLHLCDQLIRVGAKLQSGLDPRELQQIIPGRMTISRNVVGEERKYRERLQEILQGALSETPIPISITTDLWSDKVRNRKWIGITIHFWNANCSKINCIYLACEEWSKSIIACDDYNDPIDVDINIDYSTSDDEDDDIKQNSNSNDNIAEQSDHGETAKNIVRVLRVILYNNGLQDLFGSNDVFISTDCGSNVVKAIKDMNNGHVKCFNHRLNTCLQNAIKKAIDEKATIRKGIKYAKKFVTKVKKSNKGFHFVPTLKQWVETRWTTLFDLFNSIYQNYETCIKFQGDQDWKNHMRIPKGQLKQLCDFMLLVKQTHENF